MRSATSYAMVAVAAVTLTLPCTARGNGIGGHPEATARLDAPLFAEMQREIDAVFPILPIDAGLAQLWDPMAWDVGVRGFAAIDAAPTGAVAGGWAPLDLGPGAPRAIAIPTPGATALFALALVAVAMRRPHHA